MSMRLYCFIDKLPNREDLERAIQTCSFSKSLKLEHGLNTHDGGFFPVNFNEQECGVEIFTDDTAENFELIAEKLGDKIKSVNFVWSSDIDEAFVAFHLASVLQNKFDAIILDPIGMHFLNQDDLKNLCNGKFSRYEERKSNSVEKIEYSPTSNQSGLFENCQRCRWQFSIPRKTMLCKECEARCPICDSYNRNCNDPGIFQIATNKKYWSQVKLLHKQAGEELEWFELIES